MKLHNILLTLILAGTFTVSAADVPSDNDVFKHAFALAQEGKLTEAEQTISGLLTGANDPARTARILTFRGYLRAQGGRWPEAAADLKRAIEKEPSDHVSWYLLMPVLIQSGEIVDYRAQCKAMLDRFRNTTQPEVAERTAKSCLLLPYAVEPEDLILAGKVADNAVALGKKNPWTHWFQFTKGLAEYRQRHFADAIETMQLAQKELPRAQDASQDMCEADTYLILAMARHQLKQPDEARVALARARRIVKIGMPKPDSKDLGPAWLDAVMTYTLLHEAEETVAGAPATPQK